MKGVDGLNRKYTLSKRAGLIENYGADHSSIFQCRSVAHQNIDLGLLLPQALKRRL